MSLLVEGDCEFTPQGVPPSRAVCSSAQDQTQPDVSSRGSAVHFPHRRDGKECGAVCVLGENECVFVGSGRRSKGHPGYSWPRAGTDSTFSGTMRSR